MKEIISVLVENHFGVLAHIAGLFSARGFNIDSLTVGETEDPTISRMTIVVDGDERTLEQVKKQLNKLIDVIKVNDLTKTDYIDRELILIKVLATPETKHKITQLVNKYQGKILDVNPEHITVEATADQEHIQEFLEHLKTFGIKEMFRTCRVAMSKR
jgi:acetolactate synthase-1/3 small subunit